MYYFIINPASCSGKGRSIWTQLKIELSRRNISYQCAFTQKPGDATFLASSFSSSSPCTIIAVGGDGTANEVLNGLCLDKEICFGYIPTGSSNDLARGLGIPSDPLLALSCILDSPKLTFMDIGMIKDSSHEKRFAVSSGIGFDAGICHEAFHSPIKSLLNRFHLGRLTYTAIAVHQFFATKLSAMKLVLDKEETFFFKKAYMAAIMNHPCEGGGIYFCPGASCYDGSFDICVIEGLPRIAAVFVLLSVFRKKHTRFRHVHIFHCKEAVIQTKDSLPVHMDGEVFGICQNFSVSIMKKKLCVITK